MPRKSCRYDGTCREPQRRDATLRTTPGCVRTAKDFESDLRTLLAEAF